ncbi:anti-sigma factor family protein [Subtercola lobariae]|uniref:Putative zinc-finger domain-containing protein n=1 Tax=Subtercola lobariae TaxID=1588641 RepID=A0A917B813_9MICO|nr:zf-HC2 domain-containing protein [Subtercola lobariae]GGF29251.1 hypothetical protein GCM10011399_23000 [Subtercola lobariae]
MSGDEIRDRAGRGGFDDFDGTSADRYRDWDAAYVLGSLAPAERLEFEQHLAQCESCSAAVAELAGMPGLLASLTPAEAFELDEPGAVAGRVDAPPSIMPTLLSRARASRRRSRLTAVTVAALSVAAAVVLTVLVVVAVNPSGAPSPSAQPGDTSLAGEVTFVSANPSPLSAVATLHDEPWGTRIEWKCTYAENDGAQAPASAATPGSSSGTPAGSNWAGAPGPASSAAPGGNPGAASSAAPSGASGGAPGGDARSYAMLVVDRAGTSVQVATWTSGPGTVAMPTATTSIRVADIESVQIVASDTGQVLLTSVL